MRVILDEREHALYEKCEAWLEQNPTPSIQLSKKVLHLGDILIQTDDEKDMVLIERKSFADLLASIKDGRYEEQSYRLVHSSGFPLHSILYVVEGMFAQLKTAAEKRTIYSAMTSLYFFKGCSVYRTSAITETAEWLLLMADKIHRELGKGKMPHGCPAEGTVVAPTQNEYCHVVKKVKKENVSEGNIGEIMLCQIPGISSTTAMAIMRHYPSFPAFLDELRKNPACIDEHGTEANGKIRKISKKSTDLIRKYLVG